MPKIGRATNGQASSQVQIGDCTLIYGNCLTNLSQLEWHSVDMVVMDPPYGIEYWTTFRTASESPDMISGDENLDVLRKCLPILSGKLKSDGFIFCFCSPKNVDEVLPIFRATNLTVRNLLVWDKTNWGPGDLKTYYATRYELIVFAAKSSAGKIRVREADILTVPRVGHRHALHPNQKPVRLLKRLIRQSPPGSLVVDPFMGSCSTGDAAQRMGRRFWGCEVDTKYYTVAKDRITRLCQSQEIKKPSPVSGGREL